MYCTRFQAFGLRPLVPTSGTADAVADDVATKPAAIVASAIVFIVQKANQTNCAVKSHHGQHHSFQPAGLVCHDTRIALNCSATRKREVAGQRFRPEMGETPARYAANRRNPWSNKSNENRPSRTNYERFADMHQNQIRVLAHTRAICARCCWCFSPLRCRWKARMKVLQTPGLFRTERLLRQYRASRRPHRSPGR